jgi:hypothetical protein
VPDDDGGNLGDATSAVDGGGADVIGPDAVDAPGADVIRWDAVERPAPVSSADPSPPIVLTLLPSPDPQRPFQHAAEVSIAARDGHVVVAAINIHTDGPETLAAASLLRGVGIALSHDFGATFAAPTDPGLVAAGAAETSDPVVRVTTGGTFWFSTLSPGPSGTRGLLLRSTSAGDSWDLVQDALPAFDKEWIAVTQDGGLVMAANGGFWRFDAAGVVTASYLRDPDWPVMGAYVDARGAHFALERSAVLWTGDESWRHEGSYTADAIPGWSVPIGPTDDGGTWAVYERRRYVPVSGSDAAVELRLFAPGDTAGQLIPVSAPGVPAFMPAAAVDADGRMHVIWYESGGAQGLLVYTRSISRDLRMGFGAARIIDPDACPGQGWLADYTQSPGDRRLREYIDLSIDGRRVHAAWTHAPTLPSRIYTSHWDF